MKRKLRFVSFFAGIGGFDLACERAGMNCVAKIEIDAACHRVLERHFPKTDRSITDVKKAKAESIPDADVYCGGFPCQDVSVAGKGAGLSSQDMAEGLGVTDMATRSRLNSACKAAHKVGLMTMDGKRFRVDQDEIKRLQALSDLRRKR